MAVVIEVLDGGLATTVQDAGRPGYRSLGVALSGALDPLWLECANALVGNAADATALEMRLTGPRLRVAGGRVRVALVGQAEGEVRRAVSRRLTFAPWQSMALEEGDELRIRAVRGGIAYLAVSGGIDTPPQLGSRATHLRAGMGGVQGRALMAGDRLPAGAVAPNGPERRQAAFLHETGPIRLLPGPQDDYFTRDALRALIEGEHIVSRDADRMGLRLQGPRLEHDAALGDEIPASRWAAPRNAGAPSGGSEATRAWGSFISDGVAPGTLQVPPDGQPILLLADCQTVGGYPKIATVIRADLPRLAHLLPDDRLRFAIATRAEALAALRAQRARLDAWRAGIAACRPAGDIDEAALYSANLISGAMYDGATGDPQ
ncbi:MAG: biotin-dependent carboxyltransferase family protein [Rhodocyclales bacterium]|nr:biotin-dependent carboxyltransferase family protein [Rhodocyclales bacterium]